jgi:AhpD family alkylhydroperoxidase
MIGVALSSLTEPPRRELTYEHRKEGKMADDVQVENRRLDASENEALIGLARMGVDAFGHTADLRIDRHLAELLRLRVSQLNNCTYCLNLHYQAAREAGIPRAKIDTLTAWWETELHSEAEQAALRYTRRSPVPPIPTGTRRSRAFTTRSPRTSARRRSSRSSASWST